MGGNACLHHKSSFSGSSNSFIRISLSLLCIYRFVPMASTKDAKRNALGAASISFDGSGAMCRVGLKVERFGNHLQCSQEKSSNCTPPYFQRLADTHNFSVCLRIDPFTCQKSTHDRSSAISRSVVADVCVLEPFQVREGFSYSEMQATYATAHRSLKWAGRALTIPIFLSLEGLHTLYMFPML